MSPVSDSVTPGMIASLMLVGFVGAQSAAMAICPAAEQSANS
jgi:hypothetical protein